MSELDVQRQIREIRRELDQLRSVQYPVRQTKIIAVNGVEFPTVQVPSANAYTLDDYRELTWMSSLLFGGAAVGMAYVTRVGTYTKIGNVVILEGRIVLSAKGTSVGIATITGLIYAATLSPAGIADTPTGMAGISHQVCLVMAGSTLYFVQQTAIARASLTEANFTNTSDIRWGLTYRV